MHKLFLYFFLSIFSGVFSVFAQEQSEIEDPAKLVAEAESLSSQFHHDSAIIKLEKAIELYKKQSDKKGIADTYQKLGLAQLRIGKYAEASEALNAALSLHEELNDRLGIGDDLTAFARIHVRQGDYEKTFVSGKRALAIHEELGNKKGTADTLLMLAIGYDFQGDYKEALDYAGRALEISEEINHKEGVAGSLSTQGSTYWKKGDLDLALEKFQRALTIFEEIDDLRGQGRVHGNMGLVYWNQGELPLALEHTEKSLQFAVQTGSKGSEATNHYNSALMLMEQGDYQEAMEKFQKSVSMGLEMGDKGLISVCYEGLGKLNKYFGDYDRALEYFKKSHTIAKEIGEKRAEAYALSAMGTVYELRGNYSMAIESYEKAYHLCVVMDDKRATAKRLENIGSARLNMKKYDDALTDFYKSLDINKAIGAKFELPENYRMIGLAYHGKNQLNEAEDALTKSIEFARASELANPLWMALHRKGLVVKDAGRPEEALPLLTESIDVVERMRTELGNIEQRAGYLEKRIGLYEDTIHLLVSSNKIPQAFEYVQRSKARSFLDMLAEAQIDTDSSLNPDLRDSRKKILANIMKSQKNLQDEKEKENPDNSKINQIKNKQDQLEKQYADLILEIRNKNPMYAEIQYPQPLTLAEAQTLLDDQTLLLEYFLGTAESLLFVASRENINVFKLKGEKELSRHVNELREVMMKPDAVYQASENTHSRYVNLAHTLYSEILKPAESIFQNKVRVVIAPDGALSYLPFESLLTQKVPSGGINFSKLPYMARDFEIDYVPSISVLASIGKNGNKTVQPQKQLLAFADPVLKGARSAAKEPSEARNVRSWAGTLTPLPHAREEVEGIARFYQKEDVTVAMGTDASEANVKNMGLQDYKRVHFASHGLIDEEKPQFSALVLTGDNQGEDGFLTMREVFDLKLNADLVVLSACKSGLGKEFRGEGITGISRAFLCAGTPSVVVSLWDVYDRSTADLMTSFYKNLETKGLNKAAALRAARLEMIQSAKYNHPYYWAPFVLIGKR
jgi:CHAT domain-containing protein/Tfp pilus assembly protein PilF